MKTWWANGVRFQCQQSGKCCTSHGGYSFVYLTLEDRQNMAKELGLSTRSFTSKYCEKDGEYFHLKNNRNKGACRFLVNKKCEIYKARPTQCRTWPFWPETLEKKIWNKEVKTFCPGVGKGPLVPAKSIANQLNLQKKSDKSL